MRGKKVLKRQWATTEGWRDTKAGMWAWLLQRVAAIAVIPAIALHLGNPFARWTQVLLLALVLIHGLLGVRSLLLDMGLPVRWHRALFIAALGLSVVLFLGVWSWRWS